MRALRHELGPCFGVKYIAFCGWTSLWMFPIGGFCGVFIGALNEQKKKLKIITQALVGTLGVFGIEFTTGMFFNVLLGFKLWNYSHLPLNLFGQISLVYFPIWFFLVPLTMWVDDILRHFLYGEDKPETLGSVYKRLFTFQ